MRTLTVLVCWLLAASPPAPAQPSRPRILGLAHVALYVKSVEQARAFYSGLLGYAEPFSLLRPDGGLSLTFLKINERQYLEIFPESEPGADRLHHIAIETDDAERLRQYLAWRGVKAPDRVARGRIGNSNFTVRDPDGHTLEIVQYEPTGWSRREEGRFLPESRISSRMLHAGILVGDLQQALAFYRDVLGFRETWRGSRDGATLSWVNLQVPDGTDYIEFMLYKDLPAPTQRGVQHHICLETPDLAAAVSRLEANPRRREYPRPIEIRVGINRKRLANLFDPDGTRVELMEPDTVDGVPAPPSTAPAPR